MFNEPDDLNDILNELRADFIETTSERLVTVDDLISDMMSGTGEIDHNIINFQRHIHSIKGQGGTFDFPAVSTIAHRLEDYMETAQALDSTSLKDVQIFVDHIRRIVESGTNPPTEATEQILRSLPVTAIAVPKSTQSTRPQTDDVSILLVMPKGAQRKIIGKELASSGCHIVTSDTPIDAIRIAIAHPPEVVIASHVMDEMSGEEFAKTLNIVKATRGCRVVIATATDINKVRNDNLPEGTAVIGKGPTFIKDLTGYMDRWGYFG